jgi:hypothetical protein
MEMELFLIFLLFTKHFIVDFPLQKEYQWRNKGTYGHPGGLLHAGLHGIATWACFAWIDPTAGVGLGVIDALLHYHIDWAKMNLNAKMGWGPSTHEEFWILLGVDQYLHAITYFFLIYLILP